jgi:yecA family protein
MTRNPALPDFDDLASVFTALGGLQSPSEVHGYLTGQLAAGHRLSTAEWLDQLTEFCDFQHSAKAEQQILLDTWLRSTARALSGDALDFSLLLPDDDDEIAARVECLGHWCQGFLAGFALAGQQIKQLLGAQQYSEDISEAINDIATIAQIGFDDDGSYDSSENDTTEMEFIEVSEHVRMAALTIFFECNAVAVDARDITDGEMNNPAAHPNEPPLLH